MSPASFVSFESSLVGAVSGCVQKLAKPPRRLHLSEGSEFLALGLHVQPDPAHKRLAHRPQFNSLHARGRALSIHRGAMAAMAQASTLLFTARQVFKV